MSLYDTPYMGQGVSPLRFFCYFSCRQEKYGSSFFLVSFSFMEKKKTQLNER